MVLVGPAVGLGVHPCCGYINRQPGTAIQALVRLKDVVVVSWGSREGEVTERG